MVLLQKASVRIDEIVCKNRWNSVSHSSDILFQNLLGINLLLTDFRTPELYNTQYTDLM